MTPNDKVVVKGVGAIVLIFLLLFLLTVPAAVIVMVVCHILHAVWPAVPAFGFWVSWWIGLAIGLIRGVTNVSVSK